MLANKERTSCFYTSKISGLINYWSKSEVGKLLSNLTLYCNTGQDLLANYSSEQLFLHCEEVDNHPAIIKYHFYNKAGTTVLEVGYNWLLVRRGFFSEEIAEQSGKTITSLLSALDVSLSGTQFFYSRTYFCITFNRVEIRLYDNICRTYASSYFFKSKAENQIILPMCESTSTKHLMEILTT